MLITKFNLLNQRGTEKLIIKTSTHHSQCKLLPRSSGQLEPLVRQHYKYLIDLIDLTIKIMKPDIIDIKKEYKAYPV